MIFTRIALLAALALVFAGCVSTSAPRPTFNDDPATGRRCLEFALSGCVGWDRPPP
jgi:PBP1b-binding outer membrane lipoprotein LpoB